jgi:hypothetical protein
MANADRSEPITESQQPSVGAVSTWSKDAKRNLPELGRGADVPAVGTAMGGVAPLVALVFGKDTPDQRVFRLSLEDAEWLGTRLISESERARHVWRGAPGEPNPNANDTQPESGR